MVYFNRFAALFNETLTEDKYDGYTTYIKYIGKMGKKYKFVMYSSEEFKHRFDGPAVYAYTDIDDREEPNKLTQICFYHNNIVVPDWVPKVSEFGCSHELNNIIILKTSLKYNAEYGAFLKTYYEQCIEDIKPARKIIEDISLELIVSRKSIKLTNLCVDIFNLFLKDSGTNIEVASKLIKDVIIGMKIDNKIEYIEECDLIKVKEN